MMKKNLHTKKETTALITGASCGIGYDLAKIFAKNNHNLVLVARSEEKLMNFAKELEEQYKINCRIICCDLSKVGAAQEIARKTKALNLSVDYLVNNAGFGNFGFFKDIEFQRESDSIQVNVTALTELSKLFLPSMLKKRFGGILNVASTAAFQPGPLMAVYYATKAYVTSFSEALANELMGTGVHVSVLCPGPTKTNFQIAAKMEKSKLFSSLLAVAESETVALAGYKGFFAHKKIIIPGILNKIGAYSNKLVSRDFAAHIARKLQEKKAEI